MNEKKGFTWYLGWALATLILFSIICPLTIDSTPRLKDMFPTNTPIPTGQVSAAPTCTPVPSPTQVPEYDWIHPQLITGRQPLSQAELSDAVWTYIQVNNIECTTVMAFQYRVSRNGDKEPEGEPIYIPCYPKTNP